MSDEPNTAKIRNPENLQDLQIKLDRAYQGMRSLESGLDRLEVTGRETQTSLARIEGRLNGYDHRIDESKNMALAAISRVETLERDQLAVSRKSFWALVGLIFTVAAGFVLHYINS